jgi:uncharacterized membrane protein YeaQ/YmgE (transglycosylase-associated protein family)
MGIATAFSYLVFGALVLATAAIGLDCINSGGQYKNETQKGSNRGYLIASLIGAIIVILLGFLQLFFDFSISKPTFKRI